jgi:hypothetical protein
MVSRTCVPLPSGITSDKEIFEFTMSVSEVPPRILTLVISGNPQGNKSLDSSEQPDVDSLRAIFSSIGILGIQP